MKLFCWLAGMSLLGSVGAHAASVEVLYCKSEMSVLTITKGSAEYTLSLTHPVTREQILEIYKDIEISETQLKKLLSQPVQNQVPAGDRFYSAGKLDSSVLKNGFRLTGKNGSASFAHNERGGIDVVFVTRYAGADGARSRTSKMPFGRVERSTCSVTSAF